MALILQFKVTFLKCVRPTLIGYLNWIYWILILAKPTFSIASENKVKPDQTRFRPDLPSLLTALLPYRG
uniref:Uncharacterized protein n=1 Tax=Picea glauca TaxID=3330 RepID=A0A101LWG8_PICGL|nr:hypothetical protein ABT39_MTgene1319 [Picea glauca]QHR89533.1 hypothetical protein Q903MT_gene3555 [Picea sitchensis]